MKKFLANEDGATAIEYALIAALIGIFLITALNTLSHSISESFDAISAALPGGKTK